MHTNIRERSGKEPFESFLLIAIKPKRSLPGVQDQPWSIQGQRSSYLDHFRSASQEVTFSAEGNGASLGTVQQAMQRQEVCGTCQLCFPVMVISITTCNAWRDSHTREVANMQTWEGKTGCPGRAAFNGSMHA